MQGDNRLTKLEETVSLLTTKARAAQSRALAILGSCPGPGTDILLIPTNPISSFFTLCPLTAAGRAFVERIWLSEAISTVHAMQSLRSSCADWGLKVEVDWSTAEAERLD